MSIDPIPTLAAKRGPTTVVPASGKTIYTCPMHPEVQQEHPGDCPKCGMTLEPKMVTAGTDDGENAELRDMTKRFWIGAALTLLVFVLAMAHLIPALAQQSWAESHASRWIQFALTTPVVWWAGWPFFRRGWRSVVTRHLNMFTLIAIGVGAAFVFSAVAMLTPNIFPHTMRANDADRDPAGVRGNHIRVSRVARTHSVRGRESRVLRKSVREQAARFRRCPRRRPACRVRRARRHKLRSTSLPDSKTASRLQPPGHLRFPARASPACRSWSPIIRAAARGQGRHLL